RGLSAGGSFFALGVESGPSRPGTPTASIERATIQGDGSLGTFGTSGASSLTTARSHFAAVAANGSVFVIGGIGSGSATLGTIERAQIQSGGTLGSFTTVAGSTLLTPRSHHAAVVADGYLYVLGGLN